MTHFYPDAEGRARAYCQQRSIAIVNARAGSGTDGVLMLTSRQSYIKIFHLSGTYHRECQAYQRLNRHHVHAIEGHWVPDLIDHDDDLHILELSTVTRPFVLDFGKIQLDQRLEDVWPEDVLAERWEYWESLFTSEEWPTVLAIFHELGGRLGIWMEDIHPGNIAFAKTCESDTEDRLRPTD